MPSVHIRNIFPQEHIQLGSLLNNCKEYACLCICTKPVFGWEVRNSLYSVVSTMYFSLQKQNLVTKKPHSQSVKIRAITQPVPLLPCNNLFSVM